MGPHDASPQRPEPREVLEAIWRIATENPNLKIGDLEATLPEHLHSSPPGQDRRLQTRKATCKYSTPQPKTKESRKDDDEDCDDGYEADGEDPCATFLPKLRCSSPELLLPVQYNASTRSFSAELDNAFNPDTTQLVKGSDGIRNKPPWPHGNSIIGGIPIVDVQRSIHAAMPSQTLLQEARIRQQKRDKATSGKQTRSPSSKGSPRPWPMSPLTPIDKPDSPSSDRHRPHLKHAMTLPLSTSYFRSLSVHRDHSESPQRMHSRLHKQRARRSAPSQSAPFETYRDSSTERGRPRLQKGSSALRSRERPMLRGRSQSLTISRPIPNPQYPIEVPGRLIDPGSPRLHSSTPRPLAMAQKLLPSEPLINFEGEVGRGGRATQGTHAAARRRRKAVVVGGIRHVNGEHETDEEAKRTDR